MLCFNHRRFLADWTMGAEVIRHQLLPQNVGISGNLANYQSDTQCQKAMEASAYLQYCQPLSEKLLMELGARASGYHCQKSYYRMMPHLGVHYYHVRYGPFNFLMPIMPSINYYYKF